MSSNNYFNISVFISDLSSELLEASKEHNETLKKINETLENLTSLLQAYIEDKKKEDDAQTVKLEEVPIIIQEESEEKQPDDLRYFGFNNI